MSITGNGFSTVAVVKTEDCARAVRSMQINPRARDSRCARLHRLIQFFGRSAGSDETGGYLYSQARNKKFDFVKGGGWGDENMAYASSSSSL